MKKIKKIYLLLIVFFMIVMITSAAAFIKIQKGKTHLMKNAISSNDAILNDSGLWVNDCYHQIRGQVEYKGKVYEYNRDIMTFLVMGIDSNEKVGEAWDKTRGGQSDALLLFVVNPHDSTIRILHINRNVMTDIDVYNFYGDFVGTVKGQIALQHAYGDGMELSCARTVNVVSRLLWDIPIHGYCAINYIGIPIINDTVGGVEVTLLEDFTFFDEDMTEGKTMCLNGEQAFKYVQYRDTEVFNSVNGRMERIKQYLMALINTAKAEIRSDASVLIKLCEEIKPYVVTSINTDEIVYLVSELFSYQIDLEHFYQLEGETRMGELYEEFYVDEEYLNDLIMELFFEEVKK